MSSVLPLPTTPRRHLSPVPRRGGADDLEAEPPRLFAVPPFDGGLDGELHDGSSDPLVADPAVPDPHPEFVRSLAIAVFEVVEGLRSSTQLGAAVTFNALRQLGSLCAARHDQLTMLHGAPRSVQRAGSVRIDIPLVGVAETATVLHVGARARSVALRLEWIGRRWRATELAVL